MTYDILSSWFDVTPAGRILTRFTQDIGSIDGWLPYVFTQFIYTALLNASLFVITVWQAGLYALVPGLLLIIVGGFLSDAYLKAQISVKREMNLRKAPVISQLGAALVGLRECYIRLYYYVVFILGPFRINQGLRCRAVFQAGAEQAYKRLRPGVTGVLRFEPVVVCST